jgi:diamine N-acetyltransferase
MVLRSLRGCIIPLKGRRLLSHYLTLSMRRKVKLNEVTAKNWQAVADLVLDADQEKLVASNLYSIAESHFDPDARPRAVQAGKRVVGFLMYDVDRSGKAPRVSIYRFMIDRKHQGKGYGRAALLEALKEIRAIPGIKKVSIRYMPENPLAQRFYSRFGFVEVGRDSDGEVVAELTF